MRGEEKGRKIDKNIVSISENLEAAEKGLFSYFSSAK
jgi:hypothetical protein